MTSTNRLPSAHELGWPVIRMLRQIGGPASDAELAEQIADAMGLTHQQRTEMIPSGQETKLKNRVSWAAHHLKEIDVLYYPRAGQRALTPLGMEVTEDQVKELRAEFDKNRSSSAKEQQDGLDEADTVTAWRIRAGRNDELADFFIENGIAVVRFGQLPDLSQVSSRDEIAELISREEPEATTSRVRSRAGQLWTLRSKVRRGDLVVIPLTKRSQIALGTVTQEYWYRDDADAMRHAVSVNWQRTDVPRTAVKQDLLNSINTPGTIRAITRNDGTWRLQQLLETGQDPGPRDGHDNEAPDLAALVEQFLAESGYPTEAHEEQERLREEWAEKLAPENVADLSRHDLTSVASHGNWEIGRYVYPQAEGVMQWIQDLTAEEYSRMLDHIRYLCWDDDEQWHRYDQLTDKNSSRRTKGLAQATTSKLLAICHPKDFLAVSVQEGKRGRRAALDRLGLPKPTGSSLGRRVLDANDRLLEHLEPHFGDDTLGMGMFLVWLLDRETPLSDDPIDLAELADELLVEASFLEDIVVLLEDKGQVILYGPPGTGKTYLARALAKVLAPDESCRSLVQFHPSTSYEDFFEGYRPAGTGTDGGIRYELTPGPLARIAERASEASPNERHVMIIDEINRGNLPRVLGELLFLLEYRDEEVETLYRPADEPFELPENLWFIGTMNTADRSIALVDAALRRRFHFIPFFPDSGPMAGLLGRWLEREGEPAWMGRLVDAVNDELKSELEGSHLLLGPSHFMKQYGDSRNDQRERLRRIWEYNIEPFIEDQFFGDPDRIEHFRFDAVWNRHGPSDRRNASTVEDSRDSKQNLTSEGSGSDREDWTSRANDFPPPDRAGDDRHHAEIRQVVKRYVEFALNRDADPGSRDHQLVEEFLSSRDPEYADKTKSDYRRHIGEWFDYADATWGT